ncbi:hypothetical protein AB2M62_03905 [Sphingomonas sp. MMS12-HWE2-04]|uniref:hypothetical protein n=1 Tax=Sphingomonas sp. MMS12-HWE2-04 TaxID=3234199 RepID=UPI00384DF16C
MNALEGIAKYVSPGSISSRDIPTRMLAGLTNYSVDEEILRKFKPETCSEIEAAAARMRQLFVKKTGVNISRIFSRDVRDAVSSQDPVARDQALWSIVDSGNDDIKTVIRSFETGQTYRAQLSALLALRKLAHFDLDRANSFLESVASDLTSVDVAEWAALALQEIQYEGGSGPHQLGDSVAKRPWSHNPSHRFDVTMPLHFECIAVTRIGSATVRTVISPEWFSRIFGDAMALVRAETFQNQIILEKQVAGLHADGSMHYEHFPFQGETKDLGGNLHLHNYWSEIRRPFYTSGTAEVVDDRHPVLVDVPMTFFRMAITSAPAAYRIDNQPLPESVRGIFFGFGHVEPRVLLARGGKIGVGDFQISSSHNPATGEPANTSYYGTFYGKLTDMDENGNLRTNARDVHCDKDARLDYNGDGTFAPDPVRPDDWH